MSECPKQEAGAVDLFDYLYKGWTEQRTSGGRDMEEHEPKAIEDFIAFAQQQMRDNQPLSITPVDNFAIRLQDSMIVSLVSREEGETPAPDVGAGIAITQPTQDRYGKGGMQHGQSTQITNPVDTGRPGK